jgi:hypothetical protein
VLDQWGITGAVQACLISLAQIAPCAGQTCSGHGSCEVTEGLAACVCDDGYHADGLTCVADAAECGTPTFWGDWETGQVTGSGDHNWDNTQIVTNASFTLLSDGGARQGITYARVEVGNSGCGACTERAEVLQMKDANDNIIYEGEDSGTVRYSFSVKFDPSWQTMEGDSNGAWGIFLQLHGPDELGTNPLFAFDANDQVYFGLRGGDITANQGTTTALSNSALNKGSWVDFILTIKYAKDSSGFAIVQRRDEGQTEYSEVLNLQNVATLQYSSGVNGGAVGPHYMKHGLYRNHEPITSILYLDGFTREVVTSDCP